MDYKWEIAVNLLMVFFLIYFSFVDLRFRKVPGRLVEVYAFFGILAGLAVNLKFKTLSPFLLLGGILLALLFFLVSKFSKEAFGYGDSWGILGLSTILGLWDLMSVLFLAFFLLALCGVFMFPMKKFRQSSLPFFPFLSIGFLSVFIWKIK